MLFLYFFVTLEEIVCRLRLKSESDVESICNE